MPSTYPRVFGAKYTGAENMTTIATSNLQFVQDIMGWYPKKLVNKKGIQGMLVSILSFIELIKVCVVVSQNFISQKPPSCSDKEFL